MRLHIPQPCHENWDSMTPAEQGRFCQVCSKTVVDFTQMTDDEVLYYFTTHKEEKICGRIKNTDQLKEIVIEVPATIARKRLPYWQTFLLATLLAFGVLLTGFTNGDSKASFVIKDTKSTTVIDTPPPMPPIPKRHIDDEIYGLIVEQMPEYPNGDTAMKRFIANKLDELDYSNYNDSLPRKVIVQLTIDTTGQTSDIRIVKGELDSTFNNLIINSISQMPKWKPGKEGSKIVPIKIGLPIKIMPKE